MPSNGPCYISVDNRNKWAFTANYKGGSLAAFPIKKDGSLDTIKQFIQHIGSSINPQRQKEPHVHTVYFSPEQHYLFTTDLGTDKINKYHFNPNSTNKPLSSLDDSIIVSKSGNGPRHLDFSPDKKRMYVINELSGTIDVFVISHESKSQLIQTIETDSSSCTDKSSADIHISSDGKFLYCTNRSKYNSISSFAVSKNGTLKLLAVQSTGGQLPRNFTISPSGKYLLIANQKSSNIVVFSRNTLTGMLTQTIEVISVGNPSCLKMF